MIHNHEVAGSIPAPATEEMKFKMKDLEEVNLSSPFFFRANLGVGSSQKGFWLELKGVLARAKFRVS